ncbi:Alpha/Beta hydrolase protein [Cladochytrium replicatum]|nr:Alpha/Beta hydrolase protein [Cladochytrium replicatum]
MEVRHYVELHGFKHERHRVCTEDGYWLDVDRVVSATKQPTKGSMLLMHGLFQSSGVFTSSGPHSMAFHFVRAGYDVWLGNNRCVNKFGQPHVRYSCHDAELWDYSIDELAQHDFPSLLSYVYLHGSPRVGNPGERDADPRRVVFVGHSQGNAQAFHGLRFRPEVGNKIRCFVALAPALYLGPLLKSFPVNLLMNCPHEYFKSIFGVKQFIPIMDVVQRMAPAPMFAYLAYRMFHYLFGWRDHNWDIREKPTYFLFTPRPTAAKALEHWAQSARAGLVVPFNSESDPRAAIYPHSRALTCPVALVYGTADTIIDADALYGDLVKELNKGGKKKSGRGRLVYVDRIEGYEHMDVVWATDARWKVFAPIEELLEGL